MNIEQRNIVQFHESRGQNESEAKKRTTKRKDRQWSGIWMQWKEEFQMKTQPFRLIRGAVMFGFVSYFRFRFSRVISSPRHSLSFRAWRENCLSWIITVSSAPTKCIIIWLSRVQVMDVIWTKAVAVINVSGLVQHAPRLVRSQIIPCNRRLDSQRME